MNIEALRDLLLDRLDPGDDEQWTAQGLVRVEAASAVVGAELTRQHVTAALPELTRESLAEMRAAGPSGPADLADVPAAQPALATQPFQQPPPARPPEGAGVAGITDEEQLSDDEVMSMPTPIVMGSRVLLTRVSKILNQRANALQRRKREIEDELQELFTKSEMANRMLSRMGTKSTSQLTQDGIRSYLKQSQANRLRRAQAAQTFVAAGTTAKDVATELSGKSRLDAAMEQRKAEPGATRPAPRMPVGRQGV